MPLLHAEACATGWPNRYNTEMLSDYDKLGVFYLDTKSFAAQQAEFWKKGLAAWEQDSARIQRLKDAAEFTIYTPGSDAGIPVSILKSFAAPDQKTMDDREGLRDRISATATSLLGL